MAKGGDRKKISLLTFIERLLPLFNSENRLKFNRYAFQLFDFDRDGVLNVLNLMHLWKNISPKTKFGQEVFSLVEWEIQHNMSNNTAKRKE